MEHSLKYALRNRYKQYALWLIHLFMNSYCSKHHSIRVHGRTVSVPRKNTRYLCQYNYASILLNISDFFDNILVFSKGKEVFEPSNNLK